MSVNIVTYEPWMHEQVVKMFSEQYGVDQAEFSSYFKRFYEHEFQLEKCIRYAAVVGETVAGFQSFFYWPYTLGDKVYNSYQSGNSLVNPNYRGQGIFSSLLKRIHEDPTKKDIDFLVGFPVEASYNSFIRKGWKNIFDLSWYVRPLSAFSVAKSLNMERLENFKTELPNEFSDFSPLIRSQFNSEISEWKKAYEQYEYLWYNSQQGNDLVCFQLKVNVRKKFVKELVIGDIRSTNYDMTVIEAALKDLIAASKKTKQFTLLSIALNEESKFQLKAKLHALGFKKIKNKVHFIVYPMKEAANIEDPSMWVLFRSDIDTW